MKTNEEWTAIFEEVTKAIPASFPKPEITSYDARSMAKTIDHTLLKLDATKEQIEVLCKEALTYKFEAVCVRLEFVKQAVGLLFGSPTKVACVIGFHEGTHSTASKVQESQSAIAAGAIELDVVLNRDVLKAGVYVGVFEELKVIRSVAQKVTLKLILETSQLSSEEIIAASTLAGYAGWDFIKTSTGFCGRGASVECIELMTAVAEVLSKRGDMGKRMKVKASGGVRTLGDVRKMLGKGAERIGTSGGVSIMKELEGGGKAIGEGSY